MTFHCDWIGCKTYLELVILQPTGCIIQSTPFRHCKVLLAWGRVMLSPCVCLREKNNSLHVIVCTDGLSGLMLFEPACAISGEAYGRRL